MDPTIDPQVLQQILGLGSVDQRWKLLQGQQQDAAQTAQGVPIDYRKGKGTPLLLASLANLVSAGVGGYQAGQARAGQRKLLDDSTAARGAAGGRLMGAQAPDLQSLLTAPDGEVAQRTQAAKDAIGGQRSAGLLALLSGDPHLAGAGKEILGEASKGSTALFGMPQERQQYAAGQRSAEAATSPQTGMAYRALLKRFGADVPEGTPNSALEKLASVAEKGWSAQESAAARRDVARTNADVRAAAQQQRLDAQDEKRWTQFGQELDPTKARGGEMAKVVNAITQYGKVQQLIDQTPNPSSNQMYEIARAFDRATSGGVPTEGGTEHLIPKTALGSLRDFEMYLKGSPVGRDQQAFVQQLAESVKRETEYGQRLLREWQGKKASRYSDLAGKDQGRFLAELQNWGLTPEEFDQKTWTYKGAPKAAASAGAQPSTEDAEAIAWAKANPTDPRAVQILKMHGVR